jgi:hypothetical protein
MVSAKFNVAGEDGEWFRVRIQEEIYAHGLEGNVLSTGEKTLVVVLEGDKSVIKRMHSDMREVSPRGVQCTELIFSLDHHRIPPKTGYHLRGSGRDDQLLQVLAELERKITRIDQNLQRLIAMHEGKTGTLKNEEPPEEPKMDVGGEATSGFANMFG